MHYRAQDIYVNEDSVIIESSVSVKKIYNSISRSKYSFGKKSFNCMLNNCCDAVIYALQVANIRLKLEENRCSFKHHGFFLYVPSTISTPKEILEAAKKFKIEQLKKTHLFDKTDAIKKTLLMNYGKLFQKDILNLLHQIDKLIISTPHRIEVAHEVLEQTELLLSEKINLHQYAMLAHTLRMKPTKRTNQIYYQTALAAYLLLCFALAYISELKKREQDESLVDSVIMLTLGGLTSLLLISISSKIYYWNGSYDYLPQAMLSLVNAQQKHLQNTNTMVPYLSFLDSDRLIKNKEKNHEPVLGYALTPS
jgi:hypothetical protein